MQNLESILDQRSKCVAEILSDKLSDGSEYEQKVCQEFFDSLKTKEHIRLWCEWNWYAYWKTNSGIRSLHQKSQEKHKRDNQFCFLCK